MTDQTNATASNMNPIKAAALAALNDKGTKGIREMAGSRTNVLHVNPYLVQDSGTNVRRESREFTEKLYELAKSIAAQGVLAPLTVYSEGDDFKVSDGHRRLRATKIAIEEMGADIETIPVIPSPRGSNNADRKFDQFIRNTGEPLSPLETAMLFKDMLGMGWTVDKIVQRSGKEPAFVYRMLETAEMPASIHVLIEEGKVKATFALERYRANSHVESATVSEITETYAIAHKAAEEAGKDVDKVRATAKNLPETAPNSGRALSNETRRRRPEAPAATPATVVHADKGTDVPADTAPAADTAPKAADATKRMPSKDEALHAFSRLMRRMELAKYDRDGSDVEFDKAAMSQDDYITVRDYFRL